jgi:hypothetical protein
MASFIRGGIRPDNPDLVLAKAREGAERIAAALTLVKTFTLIAPGQEPDPTLASGALDPGVLLNDWNTTESNALLRRGIFAPSTYGRVRFRTISQLPLLGANLAIIRGVQERRERLRRPNALHNVLIAAASARPRLIGVLFFVAIRIRENYNFYYR